MNTKKIKLILNVLIASAITIVFINLISLIFSLLTLKSPIEINSLIFDNGMFFLNGENIGMNFIETKYWLFYTLLLVTYYHLFKNKESTI
ncbi:hypothetical protein GGR32_000719 [Mesonia hippocampi]|uniref:Uncharacterized protein n=1 Tax=Mesonia hippocampi TaxID=1628250 RepID=A0A840EMW0_9FLAO|nr:hypothetical protein [Mesonia hippocampi]MBB4118445.1 hypothetical protein [Mesonia hippocampi]